MKMEANRASDRTRWLTIADVAELLQVSDRTVQRWIKTGELAAHQLGRQWRISTRDLEEYLREHRSGGRYYVV